MDNHFDRFIINAPKDEISSLIKALSFEISGFGYYLQQDAGEVPAFSVRDMEWVLYTQGQVSLHCGDIRYEIEPGDMVLLEPGKTYGAQCRGDEPVHYYYIHFGIQPDYLADTYVSSIFGQSQERLLRAGTLPDFAPQFAMLLKDRLHGEMGTMALIDELLVRMSVYMMRRLWSLQASQSNSDSFFIPKGEDMRLCAQAVAIMRANMSGGLRVEKICAQMGVSESFLYKLFARVFHQSPSQYMMEERMKCACHLLLDEGCTVAETAGRLGFSSASHLSMQFKKVYGLTPSRWLKARQDAYRAGFVSQPITGEEI